MKQQAAAQQRLHRMRLGAGSASVSGVLQFLLLVRALTVAQQVVPVTVAILVVGAWLVMTGYPGHSTCLFLHSLRMSLLAVPYFGYPLWAWWLSLCCFRAGQARSSRT